MRKSYVSPEFEFIEIGLSDPICSSVEESRSGVDWGDGWDYDQNDDQG